MTQKVPFRQFYRGGGGPIPFQQLSVTQADYDRIANAIGPGPVQEFYTDGNPEVTSVDGYVDYSVTSEIWATVRAGSGAGTKDPNDTVGTVRAVISASATVDQFERIGRIILVFDTRGIPASATIRSARLRLVGSSRLDNFGSQSIRVVSSTPASNIALVGADYDQTGTAALADDVPLAGINVDGATYNNFALNAAGLAQITKSGMTKLGLRIVADAANTPPTWASGVDVQVLFKSSENTDFPLYRPILEVIY